MLFDQLSLWQGVRVETAHAEPASALQEEGLALLLLLSHRARGGVLLRLLSHWASTHGSFALFTWTISFPSGDALGGFFGHALLSLGSVHPMY